MIPFRLSPLGIGINEQIPLTLIAEQANSTVKLTASGSPTVSGLHYRIGKSGPWLSYTIGTTITLANIGDSVQFWNSIESLSENLNYISFTLTGAVSAAGNIQSLLNYSKRCYPYCFHHLFQGNAALLTAPQLSALILDNRCYRQTFFGCTGLTRSPEIPAAILAAGCCTDTFSGCTGLIEAGPIRATTFAADCCQGMFNNCYSLTAAPDLLAASLLNKSCYKMFQNCYALRSINVNFTAWIGTQSTEDWLLNVAAEGTFTKPSALPEEYGVSRIPTGWTVVNK